MLMFKLILCQMAFENPYLIERMISLKKESSGHRASPAGFESIWLAKKLLQVYKTPKHLYKTPKLTF